MFNPAAIAAANAPPEWRGHASLKRASIAVLLSKTAEYAGRFFSPSDPEQKLTAALWLLNVELTKRGVAPWFRGMPTPPRPRFSRGAHVPMSEAQHNAVAFCRLVDLEWLAHHIKEDERNRLLQKVCADLLAPDASSFIHHKDHDRGRLTRRLALTKTQQLPLMYFCSSEPARLRVSAKRRAQAKGRQIAEHARNTRYRLPDKHVLSRQQWAKVIEMAKIEKDDPGGSDLTRWLKYITGNESCRQSANKARRTLEALK